MIAHVVLVSSYYKSKFDLSVTLIQPLDLWFRTLLNRMIADSMRD